MRLVVSLTAMLILGALMAAPSVQAVQIGANGIGAEATADVKPDRLPKRSFAPATLTIRGTIGEGAGQITAIELRLDRWLQLATDTRGLATCAPAQVRAVAPNQARRRCRQALIGSGSLGMEFAIPEFRVSSRQQVLLFNAAAGRVLIYVYQPVVEGLAPAAAAFATVGRTSRRSIALPFLRSGGGTRSFRLRIGRTWRHRGQRRSFLRGQCNTGRFASRLTLRFNREALVGTVPDVCRGR